MKRRALAVMARFPALGSVKTRLAAALGETAAWRLYDAFLHDIDHRFANQGRDLVWCYTPAAAEFAGLFAGPRTCLAQRGTDLGERMFHVFADLLGSGYDSVVMIGADVPHVARGSLDAAEAHLADTDLVVGPSGDGGYYLIAMRQPHDVFSGIEMSTGNVFQETIQRAERGGLRSVVLPGELDIDTLPDLQALVQRLKAGTAPELPQTREVLRQLRMI